jgi:hypothetical protein
MLSPPLGALWILSSNFIVSIYNFSILVPHCAPALRPFSFNMVPSHCFVCHARPRRHLPQPLTRKVTSFSSPLLAPVATHYGIHSLSIEEACHVPQRSKVNCQWPRSRTVSIFCFSSCFSLHPVLFLRRRWNFLSHVPISSSTPCL